MTIWHGVFLVAALVLLWGVFLFNRLVKHRQLVREGWSGIDVQLKKRANLVPNLVAAVKGYMAHERELLEAVTRMRAECDENAPVKDREKQEEGLGGALDSLLAVVENYPELKADTNVLDLQKGLTEVENNIEMARRYYNGAVRDFNILVESFPGNLVAGLFSFDSAEFFEIKDRSDRAAPGVSL